MVKSLLTRVENLEKQNQHLNDVIDKQQQDISSLMSSNERLHTELVDVKSDLYNLRTTRAENSINTQQLALSDEVPDTRSQFTAFACTLNNVTVSCPSNRTILMTSGVYGRYSQTCDECCPPHPTDDCSESVEEARPSDWLAIQALCDGQELCQFENAGIFLAECACEASDYMQLFYDCLPDAETGAVAFTAWANTGSTTSYRAGDIIVFDEVLTNAGGHYNAATSSFVCPWDGFYLMSVHVMFRPSIEGNIYLRRGSTWLANIYIDAISGFYNRGSTTIVTECDRGEIVWVSTGNDVSIWAADRRTLFTGHILHRY